MTNQMLLTGPAPGSACRLGAHAVLDGSELLICYLSAAVASASANEPHLVG
jgi:hypothetical protein